MAYTTIADVRVLNRLDDETTYPDAVVTDGIAWATAVIDDATGTSWESKAHTLTLDGSNKRTIFTGVVNILGVTSCTIDGEAQTVTNWVGRPDGEVERDTGIFTYTAPGRNVTLVITAGATTTVPDDISWAARTLAGQYVLDLQSNVPDRAISVASEYGTIQYAQAGGRHGTTSLPDVNAVLKRRNHRPPMAF